MGEKAGRKDIAVRPASFSLSLSLLMTQTHFSLVPDDAEVYKGPKGGLFYFRNGIKVYITNDKYIRKPYRTRRGAFQRFIENQSSNV